MPVQQPSALWCFWMGLKGANPSHLTVPDADLRGQWIIVTGANNGIGREAAITMAGWGANLVLACRPNAPAHELTPEHVVGECKQAAATRAGEEAGTIEYWPIDLAELSSVVAFADRWNATGRPLDVFANNAGISGAVSRNGKVTTSDGFEIVHQVNFLSHALLALLLLPSIAKAKHPRIIGTTSAFHFLGRYDLANANLGVAPYPTNKLYYTIWMAELQRRLLRHTDLRHVRVYAVNPGYVNTGIFHSATSATSKSWITWLLVSSLDYYAITPQQGSIAITHAATFADDDPIPLRERGCYISRIWPETPLPHVLDDACRTEVWDFVTRELAAFKLPEI